MVAEMIPFIIQFAYTGGIAEGGKLLAKQALKGMGKLGEKTITKEFVILLDGHFHLNLP